VGCDPVAIARLVNELAPRPVDELNLPAAVKAIMLAAAFPKISHPLLRALVPVLTSDRVLAKLNPALTLAQRKEKAATLLNDLFICVGMGGGVAAFGPAGGTLIAADGMSALQIPPDPTDPLTRVYSIIPQTARAIAGTCIPAVFLPYPQYEECLEYNVTPYKRFMIPDGEGFRRAGIARCTLPAGGPPPATPVAYHYRTTLFTEDPLARGGVINLGRGGTTLSARLGCMGDVGLFQKPGIGERHFGLAGRKLDHFTAMMLRPFIPTIAFASDGVGGDTPHLGATVLALLPT
jgi:hypothetical protein